MFVAVTKHKHMGQAVSHEPVTLIHVNHTSALVVRKEIERHRKRERERGREGGKETGSGTDREDSQRWRELANSWILTSRQADILLLFQTLQAVHHTANRSRVSIAYYFHLSSFNCRFVALTEGLVPNISTSFVLPRPN